MYSKLQQPDVYVWIRYQKEHKRQIQDHLNWFSNFSIKQRKNPYRQVLF